MHWTKPLTLLGVAVLAVLAVGAVAQFAMAVTVTRVVTIALVVGCVAGLVLLGARSRRWRQNPYW